MLAADTEFRSDLASPPASGQAALEAWLPIVVGRDLSERRGAEILLEFMNLGFSWVSVPPSLQHWAGEPSLCCDSAACMPRTRRLPDAC